MTVPGLATRVEIRLGLAFWVIAGITAAIAGTFTDWMPYAAPVVILAALWRHLARYSWSAIVLDWVPLPLVVLTYEMLHRIVPEGRSTTLDDVLAGLDRSLLGDHASVLLEPIVSRPLTFALACFYATYYVMPVALAAWWWRRDRPAFRELVAGVVGALFIGYLGYLFLPTVGPHAFLAAETWHLPLEGDFIGPAIRSLNANHNGAFPRDAFPSLHTANAVTLLLVTFRHDRVAFAVCLVPCLALVFATVYLRFHYVVDVLAGAALAVLWQLFVPRLVAREAPVA